VAGAAMVLAGLAPGAAGSLASAATGAMGTGTAAVELGSTGFGSIVVDDAYHHVFVSGPASNEVIVTDFSGTIVSTITGEDGVAGMAIDGSMLYVADSNVGAIDQIDLATLTDKGVLATGLAGMRWLAVAGGKLWTCLGGAGGWDQLASVSFDGTVSEFGGSYYDGEVSSSAATPDILYVADDDLSPGSIYRFDVSSGSPVLEVRARTGNYGIDQLTVSPDGTRVIPASGAPYDFQELAASTLQPDGVVYPGAPYPSAVAVTASRGGLIATGLRQGFSTPQIHVYPIGKPSAEGLASTNSTDGTTNVVPHGLAFSGDGSTLFAVSRDTFYDTSFTLHLVSLLNQTSTQVSAPSSLTVSGGGPGSAATVSVPPGAAQHFVASINVTSGGFSAPTGFITFADNGTAFSTVALTSGQTTLDRSWPTTSKHLITATYGGDSNNAASAGSLTVEVGYPTATVISASPNPSRVAQAVTFTASVSGHGTPTGLVTFYDGSVPLKTLNLASGKASLTIASLRAGTHVITAFYPGDSLHDSSTSKSLSQHVNRLATLTTLTRSSPRVPPGRTVTFVAKVSGSAPTGSVTFDDGSAVLSKAALRFGEAKYTTSTLTPRTHEIRAVYSGDPVHAPSTSQVVAEVVLYPTHTYLAASANPAVFGQPVRFTVTVSGGSSPTGFVAFYDGPYSLGKVALSASKSASLTLTGLAIGAHTIRAVYSGDAVNAGASASIVEAVTKT
jgi:hypothetical protein